jgi:hypothetical protein
LCNAKSAGRALLQNQVKENSPAHQSFLSVSLSKSNDLYSAGHRPTQPNQSMKLTAPLRENFLLSCDASLGELRERLSPTMSQRQKKGGVT